MILRKEEGEIMNITVTRLSCSSWFRIETNDMTIDLDPGFSGLLENQGIPANIFDKKADLVLISHGHKDHIREEILGRIHDLSTIIICPESTFEANDFLHQTIKPGQTLEIKGVKIHAINAYNTPGGHSTKKYHPQGFGVGYIIGIENIRIYHAGDSDVITDMALASDVDIAMLPIGGTYTMDFDEAIEALGIIKPKLFIPMHEANLTKTCIIETLKKTTYPFAFLTVGESLRY